MKLAEKKDFLHRSLERLEYFQVLEYLKDFTKTEPGKILAQNLLPKENLDEIKSEFELVLEMLSLLEQEGSLPLGYFPELSGVFESAGKGKVLSGRELREVYQLVCELERVKKFFRPLRERYHRLYSLIKGISNFSELKNLLERSLDEYGEVRPDASALLKQLHQQFNSLRSDIQKKLTHLLSSSKYQDILQDQFYTERDGRLVIPVKKEMQSRISGIVHDTSASGATVFIEPMELVPLNNELRVLQREIQAEKERILKQLSEKVGEYADELSLSQQILAELDLIQAKAFFAQKIGGVVPKISFLPLLRLFQIRHPLLILEGKNAIPNDLLLKPETKIIVISGPNTGGKTVFLKTIGLTILMIRAGLPVPCHPDSEIGFFPEVYALIGDEQSISQDLSSYSAHLLDLIAFLNYAGKGSLILIDEILASTDPEEASALAITILREFAKRDCLVFVTTHFTKLKQFAETEQGFINASFEFNTQTLTPTYKLRVGIPGISYGIDTAQKLGLAEKIIKQAKELINPQESRFLELLNELDKKRSLLDKKFYELAEEEKRIAELKKALQEKEAQLKSREQELKKDFRLQLERELKEARRELNQLLDQLKSKPVPKLAQKVDEKISQLKKELEEKYPLPQPGEAVSFEKLNPGDVVWVSKLKSKAEVISKDPEKQEVELAIGTIRLREKPSGLRWLEERAKATSFPPNQISSPSITYLPPSPNNTIDLRGKRADEAEVELIQYLDRAFRQSKPMVYIIHGHGTGVLKKLVRDYLKDSPYVREFRPGEPREGGDGVTVAVLDLKEEG